MKQEDKYGNVKYITAEEAASLFPPRPKESHKGTFGYAALIGGSLEYSGAIRLAAHASYAVNSVQEKEAADSYESARGRASDLAAQANAAMRSGTGVATIAAPRSICPLIAPQIMEATLYPLSDEDGRIIFSEEEFEGLCRRYDCITFGMGIGNSDETRKAVEYLLRHYDKKLIIDADGLNAMSELDHTLIRRSRARLVLTPHVKEFSRLSGLEVREITADPVSAAKSLAEELDAVVLLKGSTTVVAGMTGACADEKAMSGTNEIAEARADEKAMSGTNEMAEACADDMTADSSSGRIRVLATDRGCPGMATAGSGDVLSGILSSLCMNTDDMVLAAAAGAYINGAAGELAQGRHSDVTMTSADTAACVAEIIEGLIHNSRRQI